MQDVREIMNKQSTNVKNTNSAFDKVKDNIEVSIEGVKEITNLTGKLDSTRTAVTDTVQNLSAIAGRECGKFTGMFRFGYGSMQHYGKSY